MPYLSPPRGSAAAGWSLVGFLTVSVSFGVVVGLEARALWRQSEKERKKYDDDDDDDDDDDRIPAGFP